MPTSDLLDDSFPHGTPNGYRSGCRGSGACRNHGTALMTCSQAMLRYRGDADYRRAIDAGEMPLDKPTTPTGTVKSPRHPKKPLVEAYTADTATIQPPATEDPTAELLAARAAIDEYAASKLKAEADATALAEDNGRLRDANEILREQILEGEARHKETRRLLDIASRTLASRTDELVGLERTVEQLRYDLANEQEAYRRLETNIRRRPRAGELTVEETADGTRWTFISTKPATVKLGDVEVTLQSALAALA